MTVVVAYTPDDAGAAALEHGLAEARRREARAVVVNATKGDTYVDRRFAGSADVERLRGRLAEEGLDGEVVQEVVADVAAEVLRVAAEHEASLVVVGVRHRTPVGKALLGSVGQRIILDAPCPVLAVKPG